MWDRRTYSLFPSNLKVAKSFRKLRDHCVQSGYQEDLSMPIFKYSLTVDQSWEVVADDLEELLTLLEEYPHALEIEMRSFWEKGGKTEFNIGVIFTSEKLRVSVNSKDKNIIAAFHEKTKEFFKASNPQPDKSPQLSKYKLKKSVFLAHRFDDEGQRIAGKLDRFLSRAGFSVVEGEGYEARDIPEKVEERILSQDIFICLVTRGDPSWILTEASFARAKDKYLIIILQEGVEFNKGIIGSGYEHMTFVGEDIEKGFTDLLYALP